MWKPGSGGGSADYRSSQQTMAGAHRMWKPGQLEVTRQNSFIGAHREGYASLWREGDTGGAAPAPLLPPDAQPIPNETYPGLPEFAAYAPIDGYNEEQANSWRKEGELRHLESEVPMPPPLLPDDLKRFVDHMWLKKTHSPGADRGEISAGSHRNGAGSGSDRTYRSVPAINLSAMAGKAVGLSKAEAAYLRDTFAGDWDLHGALPYVRGYGFRGDSRPPDAIKQAGGFSPPITRTDDHYMRNTVYPHFRRYMWAKFGVDINLRAFLQAVNEKMNGPQKRLFAYYGSWRTWAEGESLHAGRMIAKEDLKGYISTSRATIVSKKFAAMRGGGWVYLLYVDGGFLVPARLVHKWTHFFSEQEFAHPGAIGWDDVVGFRAVNGRGYFSGDTYFRPSFFAREPNAGVEALHLFSGKPQN